jgi:hypothetical protein
MAVSIPDDQWQAIDEAIFANRKLPAILQIRALGACGLHEALGVLCERYAKLLAEAPDRFSCTEQEYWADFYS